MTRPAPNIIVKVDLTNPGQFFACCGLLELADRLWPGAEGSFGEVEFSIACGGTLSELVETVTDLDLEQVDAEDNMASPMRLPSPFDLILDWWTDELAGGKQLKVWAGSMRSVRIARAMQKAIAEAPDLRRLLDYGCIVYDPDQRRKKVEPFYFDGRRGWNAQSLDIGFAPDSLKMKTIAYPAVEFFCLAGLQRFRPAATSHRRVFDYYSWPDPLPVNSASVAACGALRNRRSRAYRFENSFRTAQKKHKSFLPATLTGA